MSQYFLSGAAIALQGVAASFKVSLPAVVKSEWVESSSTTFAAAAAAQELRLCPSIPMLPPRWGALSCEPASCISSSPSDVPSATLSPSPTTPPSVFLTSPILCTSLASSRTPSGSACVAPAQTNVWWPSSIATVAKPGPVWLEIPPTHCPPLLPPPQLPQQLRRCPSIPMPAPLPWRSCATHVASSNNIGRARDAKFQRRQIWTKGPWNPHAFSIQQVRGIVRLQSWVILIHLDARITSNHHCHHCND